MQDTPLLLREYLKIAAEGHSLLVKMEEIRNFWRGGSVRRAEIPPPHLVSVLEGPNLSALEFKALKYSR
jgi:hypothetical protein